MTRHRILVIDDDPLFRSLLTSILRNGFQVTSANDGEEGYYKALETPPDLANVRHHPLADFTPTDLAKFLRRDPMVDALGPSAGAGDRARGDRGLRGCARDR